MAARLSRGSAALNADQAAAGAATAEASPLLDQIVAQSKVARSDVEHARAKDIISELVREVMAGTEIGRAHV